MIRLQGEPSAPSGDTFTLQIADIGAVIVETNDLTELTDGTLPTGVESRIQVRGQRKAVEGQIVTATEISLDCDPVDTPFVQAPVEAKEPEVTVTLLGFVINVSNPIGFPPWISINEESLSRTEFFDAISIPTVNSAGLPVPGTLVKVSFDEITDEVTQAEIKD